MATTNRLVALDHLRGFIVALVVLYHAILAYCGFGHFDHRHYLLSSAPVVDPRHWVGFDIVVVLNDSFFMPLMFVLSGLFVWRGLCRKGARRYLLGRLLRLGVPFAIAVLTVVPLAYYPSWLQAGGTPGFMAFWRTMVTAGPWPSGPPWFIGVLLVFDAISALAYVGLGRPQAVSLLGAGWTPVRCCGIFLICLALAYLPFLAVFGPSHWLALGPLAIQGSRIGLYAASFAAGVALGPDPFTGGLAGFRDLRRQWPGWVSLTALTGAVWIGLQVARAVGAAGLPGWVWLGLFSVGLASFCAVACFASAAVFLRFAGQPNVVWDELAASSFLIYLLHYPLVTWVQYGLLRAPAGAILKAAATFSIALAMSWVTAALLRRIPLRR